MNSDTSAMVTAKPNRFIVVFGAIIVVGVALYFLFMFIDGVGLAEQEGQATVLGKEYREAGTTYATQKIGDRMQTVPQSTPEMYILKLNIDGQQTECAVDKELYSAVQENDRVKVTYQKRRIMGDMQILKVTR